MRYRPEWTVQYRYIKEDGTTQLLAGVPECGTDFCDRCGDCLKCWPDGPCGDHPGHLWVKYEEEQ